MDPREDLGDTGQRGAKPCRGSPRAACSPESTQVCLLRHCTKERDVASERGHPAKGQAGPYLCHNTTPELQRGLQLAGTKDSGV